MKDELVRNLKSTQKEMNVLFKNMMHKERTIFVFEASYILFNKNVLKKTNINIVEKTTFDSIKSLVVQEASVYTFEILEEEIKTSENKCINIAKVIQHAGLEVRIVTCNPILVQIARKNGVKVTPWDD